MPRYFLEVAYDGAGFAGFQRQPNALTIQQLIEDAWATIVRSPLALTGSSRTDAGVHARQNYFHFDLPQPFDQQLVYRLNALLPPSVAVRSIREVRADAHCRFDALSRTYHYHIHTVKDPFAIERSWFYPFSLSFGLLQLAADLLKANTDFTSFAKRNSQVHTHQCILSEASWHQSDGQLKFVVTGNRFLRGMVRALVATQLRVARGQISLEQLIDLIQARDCTMAYFDAPAKGLCLQRVAFADGLFIDAVAL